MAVDCEPGKRHLMNCSDEVGFTVFFSRPFSYMNGQNDSLVLDSRQDEDRATFRFCLVHRASMLLHSTLDFLEPPT